MIPGFNRRDGGAPAVEYGMVTAWDGTVGWIQPTSAQDKAPVIFYMADIQLPQGSRTLNLGDIVSYVRGGAPLGVFCATHVTLIQSGNPPGDPSFAHLFGSNSSLPSE